MVLKKAAGEGFSSPEDKRAYMRMCIPATTMCMTAAGMFVMRSSPRSGGHRLTWLRACAARQARRLRRLTT